MSQEKYLPPTSKRQRSLTVWKRRRRKRRRMRRRSTEAALEKEEESAFTQKYSENEIISEMDFGRTS